MGQNGYNFQSAYCITLKFLHEFPKAVFLGVDVESQLGDEEVLSPNLSNGTEWP